MHSQPETVEIAIWNIPDVNLTSNKIQFYLRWEVKNEYNKITWEKNTGNIDWDYSETGMKNIINSAIGGGYETEVEKKFLDASGNEITNETLAKGSKWIVSWNCSRSWYNDQPPIMVSTHTSKSVTKTQDYGDMMSGTY